MKKWLIILSVIGLSFLDQVVKIIIHHKFMDARFDIIPGLIAFKPKYNYDYFYLNQLLNLGAGYWFTVILTIVIALVFLLLYKLLRRYSHHPTLLDWSSVFIFASITCALVSHLFWKGVLDYIYLKPLFIFDLKDLYVWIGVVCLFIAQIRDAKEGVVLRWKDIKEYFHIGDIGK